MNCVKGDLAVIVCNLHFPENIGRIVRCMQYKPSSDGQPAWLVEGLNAAGKVVNGSIVAGDWASDSILRPLRDNPGTDQTLTWLDVPTKETA